MRHRKALSGAAAAVLAAILITSTGTPAMAHESLASSSPTEGEQFDTAPAQVQLVFTDEVLPVGAAVVVVDESGKDWVEGEVTLDGATVTATLAPGMPEAGYQVRWRVVSGDGHPISSIIPFTVGDAEPFTDTAAPATASPSPTPEVAETAQSTTESAALPTWGLVALGLGGAIAAAGAFFAISTFIKRRRS